MCAPPGALFNPKWEIQNPKWLHVDVQLVLFVFAGTVFRLILHAQSRGGAPAWGHGGGDQLLSFSGWVARRPDGDGGYFAYVWHGQLTPSGPPRSKEIVQNGIGALLVGHLEAALLDGFLRRRHAVV